MTGVSVFCKCIFDNGNVFFCDKSFIENGDAHNEVSFEKVYVIILYEKGSVRMSNSENVMNSYGSA